MYSLTHYTADPTSTAWGTEVHKSVISWGKAEREKTFALFERTEPIKGLEVLSFDVPRVRSEL